MDVVSHPLDDLEPAPRDCRVRGMGVLDGNDAIFRTPDDERRHPGGQVELIGRAHRLTTRVDDGAQRAQEGATRLDVPERSVAPPELGNHGRVFELLAERDAVWQQNQVEFQMTGQGGVPTMSWNGEPFFGQDRFDQFFWRLRQNGLTKRKVPREPIVARPLRWPASPGGE